ncbi:DUF2326 domain-containing protein [Sulfurimonas sp.]|uniref:DUF2326 domain-containing protein n=1 Tax=Sulfurimonas sp. TaxID=2022749 RepID=UPI0025FB184A|nr:DUF2326 domain-containing protein [Sulfurimonas sp.]
MKLCKIYANGLFHNVEFSEGLNVIIGKISNRDDSEKDTHNLGKSLLLEVIDFLLLKKVAQKDRYFLTRNKIFASYVFFAEIKLNNGKHLLIKRAVENNTKISFKLSDNKLEKFDIDVKEWDDSDLAIDKARETLNTYLGFDILPKWKYRKTLNYFMRYQNDYIDVFKLSKFQGVHKDWKPMVFDLLGFNGELIKQKLELEEEYDALEKKITLLETENKVSSTDEDKVRGLLDIKTDEVQEISAQINKFDFHQQDNEQKKYLIEELENQIKVANTQHYGVKHEILKVEQALMVEIDNINLEEIQTLYSEIQLFFPNELLTEFKKVINFNRSITQERNIFLKENLTDLKAQSEQLDNSLKQLEAEKSSILSDLTDKDSYDKFKKYQMNLSKIEADVIVLEEKLLNISKMSQMQETLAQLSSSINQKIVELKSAIAEQKHKHLRKLFNEFTMDILNTPAVLSVRANKENNIEFEAEYQNKDSLVSTDLASGNTYKKILCAAFDVSLLQHYNENSFYKFVYHDGVLDTLDIRKKEKYIEFIRKLTKKYDVQYILTAIESEINQLQNAFSIQDDEVCLTLSDDSCEGKLFKQCF